MIYLNFKWQNSFEFQYLPHPQSKFYKIYSIESYSSRSFPTTPKTHPNSSETFFVMIQFNFQWKNHSILKNFTQEVQTSWNQANAPLLIESFPKIPRTRLKCPGLLDLIVTKQNNLPCFRDRYIWCLLWVDISVLCGFVPHSSVTAYYMQWCFFWAYIWNL